MRPFAEIGFAWGLRHGARSLALALGAGFGFGLWMVAADRWLFADIVPPSQHALFAGPAFGTLLYLVLRDEAVLRGIVLPGLLWAGLARRASLAAVVLTALVGWPLLNSGYIAGLDWTGPTVAREMSLHVAAGSLWGWLCWRHGWLAGLAGHLAAYAALLPLS